MALMMIKPENYIGAILDFHFDNCGLNQRPRKPKKNTHEKIANILEQLRNFLSIHFHIDLYYTVERARQSQGGCICFI